SYGEYHRHRLSVHSSGDHSDARIEPLLRLSSSGAGGVVDGGGRVAVRDVHARRFAHVVARLTSRRRSALPGTVGDVGAHQSTGDVATRRLSAGRDFAHGYTR